MWNFNRTVNQTPQTRLVNVELQQNCQPDTTDKTHQRGTTTELSTRHHRQDSSTWNYNRTVNQTPQTRLINVELRQNCQPDTTDKTHQHGTTTELSTRHHRQDSSTWNYNRTVNQTPQTRLINVKLQQNCQPDTTDKTHQCGTTTELSTRHHRQDSSTWNYNRTVNQTPQTRLINVELQQNCQPDTTDKTHQRGTTTELSTRHHRQDSSMWNYNRTVNQTPQTRLINMELQQNCQPDTTDKTHQHGTTKELSTRHHRQDSSTWNYNRTVNQTPQTRLINMNQN